MDKLWTAGFFSNIVICYFLDGILIVYCILMTAFFFKERFSYVPAATVEVSEEYDGISQELETPNNADPLEVRKPRKRKKKAGKKKKSAPAQPEERDKDPYESLLPTRPPPPRVRQ